MKMKAISGSKNGGMPRNSASLEAMKISMASYQRRNGTAIWRESWLALGV
jgi:hypothetical protein